MYADAQYDLTRKHVAILVDDCFEQIELTAPREALRKAGAATSIISPKHDRVMGYRHGEKGQSFPVDMTLREARAEGFDALLLPGGSENAETLRADPSAVKFVRDFFIQHKPVAAICHGPAIMIEAEVIDGREMTSHPSLSDELTLAGAHWLDQPVIVDQGLVTSRRPDDLEAFNARMLEEIYEGRHAGQHA